MNLTELELKNLHNTYFLKIVELEAGRLCPKECREEEMKIAKSILEEVDQELNDIASERSESCWTSELEKGYNPIYPGI